MSALLIDYREGSHELLKPLREVGLPVEETKLDFGDLAFIGRGEGGKPLFIGIEHKKVNDLISSLNTERLQGHQLLGMLGVFQDRWAAYDRRWLIIEGEMDADRNGAVTTWKGKRKAPVRGAPNAVELEKRLLVLHSRLGVDIRHSRSRRETINFILALYRMWTDKDLDEHKSHLAMYSPDIDCRVFEQPSDFRKGIAAMLPDVKSAVSHAIEREVGGVDAKLRVKLLRMLAWKDEQWADLLTVSKGKSRRLGESRAKKIMEALG